MLLAILFEDGRWLADCFNPYVLFIIHLPVLSFQKQRKWGDQINTYRVSKLIHTGCPNCCIPGGGGYMFDPLSFYPLSLILYPVCFIFDPLCIVHYPFVYFKPKKLGWPNWYIRGPNWCIPGVKIDVYRGGGGYLFDHLS